MQLEYAEATFVAGILAICAGGLGGSASPWSWTIFAGLAVLTPLVMLRYGNAPRLGMLRLHPSTGTSRVVPGRGV